MAELWNRDVNTVTVAFSPISRKNNGVVIFPKEMPAGSNISARAKNMTKLVACCMKVNWTGLTACENLFCRAMNSEKNMALHRAKISPALIFRPLPAQVMR